MNWFRIFISNLFILFVLLGICEGIARLLIDFDANYYAAPSISEANSENVHPYGVVPINSRGFFDKEWDVKKTKHRRAYFGDSVAYGVGAGFPYRITEYLDVLDRKKEHVNISGGINASFMNIKTYANFLEIAFANEIDSLIYLMNLNDLAPAVYGEFGGDTTESKAKNGEYNFLSLKSLKKLIQPVDSLFRGNSRLYTYMRYQIKNIMVIYFNVEATGFKAIELEPNKYKFEIELAAKKIGEVINAIQEAGINVCVLILPYEMQISVDAAKKYRDLKIHFEDAFLDFKTQKIFANKFSKVSSSKIISLGSNFPQADVGSYYVFNKGDKIDFNHPNRLGHKILAEEIFNKSLCDS